MSIDGSIGRYPPLPQRNSLNNINNENKNNEINKEKSLKDITLNSNYDFSLLDYKSSDEFIKLYLNKIGNDNNDNQNISNNNNSNSNNNNNSNEKKLLYSLASQLKLTRGILSLSMALQSNKNTHEIIHQIIDCTGALLDVEKAFYLEASNENIILKSSYNYNSSETKEITFGIECDVVTSRRPLIIHDVQTNTRVNPEVYKYLKIIPRNLICYPVILSNEILGVILVLNKLSVNSSFSSFDLWCLEYISSYVATAHLLKNNNQQDTIHLKTINLNNDQIDQNEVIVHSNDKLKDDILLNQMTSPLSTTESNSSNYTIHSNITNITPLTTNNSTSIPELTSPSNINLNISSNNYSFNSTNSSTINTSSILNNNNNNNKIINQSSIEYLIEELINNAYHILHADKISLFLPNEKSNKLICTISRDIKGMQISMDEGLVGQTLKSKVPMKINNARENIHHSNSIDNITGYNTISLLSYPILSKNGNQVYGVLQAINKNKDDGMFTTEDGAYLSNLCNYISELISSQTEYLMETMNQNILKTIGDYSYSAGYNYRKHLYDNLDEYNEVRILELISYCKLIGSCDQVLMYSLKSLSNEYNNNSNYNNNNNNNSNNSNNYNHNDNSPQLELRYKETLSRSDSNSIINPVSGEYGSVYSLPSYREQNIPKSVLNCIQNNLITQISLDDNEYFKNIDENNNNNDNNKLNKSDFDYLKSVNSTAAIIIPIHLLSGNNHSNNNNNNNNNGGDSISESPIDVLIMLKSQPITPPHTQSIIQNDSYPSFSYLFNPSLSNFTLFQFEGINSLMKIFNSTYQLSITHREETNYQTLLENKINIMNETLVQLDTMYVVLSSDGYIKLYNPSFEDFLGIPSNILETILLNNSENINNNNYHNINDLSEYQLIDLPLDKLFPENNNNNKNNNNNNNGSINLIKSFKECIRSGKIIRENSVELKTYKYPNGINVSFEIYEYFGNYNKSQTVSPSPRKKLSTKKFLQKFESFHFDNNNNNNGMNLNQSFSSPNELYGRHGKMFRISIRYLDNLQLREVIQKNTIITENFPSYPDLDENISMDCLVNQTKDEIFNTPIKSPNKQRHSLGSLTSPRTPISPLTSPRNKISPTKLLFKDESISNNPELNNLFTWNFNSLNVTIPDLQKYCAITIIEKNINITELNIPKSFFYNLIFDIEQNYYSNPFHNFKHALCVLQCLYMLLENTNYSSHINTTHQNENDITSSNNNNNNNNKISSYHILLNSDSIYFALLLSALFHDIRHPGNTNIYEIHFQSPRALLYNDVSVLENYHCSTAFHLMNISKNNIFVNYSLKEKLLIRKVLISCILATDMAQHNLLIEQLNEKCRMYSDLIKQNNYQFIQENINEVIFYSKILLHCADLSNPVRPFLISKQWAELVSEEFNEQGKKEVYYNLPVSTYILSPDIKTLIKNEIYFCNEVVYPLWNSFSNYFPSCSELTNFVNQIKENVTSWNELNNTQKND